MISLFEPKIIDYPDKTPVPSGGGFIYNLLPSDRRFEELLYTIYKQKIENERTWNDLYDHIYLTAASGDNGADCILYKNGTAKGVIQCKKYNANITKTDFIKEILKFVLYTIVDNSLMPDSTNFDYRFAVSKGFSKPAMDLLANFNNKILLEENLENWFNDLKKKYHATLYKLNFKDIQQELFSKLKSIRIEKITPQELDTELNQPYNIAIQPIFFQIRTVTDNSLLKNSMSVILQSINSIPSQILKINLTEAEILQKFDAASLQLTEWKDDFSNVNDSHIERNETKEILNWVNGKLPKDKDPLLMVTGNPGFGKSVILKNTLKQLSENNIPVIGLKADRYYTESIEKFNELTNLKYPLEKLIDLLLKKYDKVVVLIDQIDALSSALTSKTNLSGCIYAVDI